MVALRRSLTANGLMARAMRGSAVTASGYVASQAVRLGSNLILTRLLFPEAFGMMALVQVFLVGLAMVSDAGICPAIVQNRRGDEPDFLDTAWTLQVLRGAILWGLSLVVAGPIARFYAAPELALLLPAAATTLLIGGFNPTRIDTATRGLTLGLVTTLDLAAQVTGIAVMVVLAAVTGSVWSLVAGSVAGALVKLALCWRYLPGPANRLRWERSAVGDLVRFGKWIFLATASGFLIAQGDKAILGAYLSLTELGVYNIGWFLASIPMLLGGAVISRILIPLYAARAEGGDGPDPRLRRMRAGLTATVLGLLGVLAFASVPLVGLLYDDRYAMAGAIVVAIACVQVPAAIGLTYDQAALAAGDSRRFFYQIGARAAVQTLAFLAGAAAGGIGTALLAQGLALLVLHPGVVWLARVHGVWDARHDALFFAAGAALVGAALWFNRAELVILWPE